METQLGEQLDELAVRMAPLRLDMTPAVKSRLQRFAAGLLMWNRRYALMSRRDAANIVRKHVAASLAALLLTESDLGAPWVDVGSGAGLPGLVLKIWCPEQEIVLIEGSRRKCVFVQSMVGDLGLGATQVLPIRVEALIAQGVIVGRFQVLLCRAVADVSTTLRAFGPLLRPGGKVLTFKGPGWAEEVARATGTGLLGRGGFHLEMTMAIPWCQGRILQIRKACD